ncbi:MAG: T9SS type A sorting domain-containing protein [Sporocytophaga sp.]|uniref:choice-of-anchor Q domain-containing protein n=1 Tax=Sporocytophaga sp. TaxID=2231183 RepID=UPI001B1CBD52|nr:choice-of-anchor Q domain-containing protein [Sporocytophaga sp.]MBO9702854.1 T9SS type A sorting domain-containing protein [Sporocytophaga sp.]
MKKRRLIFTLALLCFLGIVKSHATKLTVTNGDDEGPGSLRNTVNNAAAGDTIVFSSAVYNSKIILSNGSLILDRNLVIIGPGQDKLSISGSNGWSVLIIASGANTFISGITITEGNTALGYDSYPESGAINSHGNLTMEDVTLQGNSSGAIYNVGSLSLTRVTISNNSISTGLYKGESGAIHNAGTASIKDCEISNNSGWGIFLDAGTGGISNLGTMSIFNSSIHNNVSYGEYSSGAGGIKNTGNLNVYNCTISSNVTSSRGGSPAGIYNINVLNIEHSTIAFNITNSMGGFARSGIFSGGTLTIKNTIIAQNGPEDVYYIAEQYPEAYGELVNIDGEIRGTINDLGYNFIGVSEGTNLTAPTSKIGYVTKPIKPLLGPLQNNGGITSTHALLEGSRCINSGKFVNSATYDQRGYLRTRPDIGAYEFISKPAISIVNPVSGANFDAPADIKVDAELSNQKAYLLITSVPGYRKLKLGYDSVNIYHATKNVIAGGNNKLEITLRDFDGNADWTKIQIRPNGSTANPVALAQYINQAGGAENNFITITIPLSAFDSSIDFSKLNLFELPYSTNAGSFKIGIQKIIFTGGTTPFLWFGDSKIENAFDGGAVGGQLYASLIPATSQNYINKVEFYDGTVKLGEDAAAPYSINLENVNPGNYQITAVAKTIYGELISSLPVEVNVSYPARESAQETSLSSTDALVFPNPVVDKITIKPEIENAKIIISDINGAVQLEKDYNGLSGGQADLSFLIPGIYFIKIEGQDNQYKKVVKLVKL